MDRGKDQTMDSYETLARRAAALAESSIEDCDRRFWTTYALGMSMLASVEVEQHSAESRAYREAVLTEVERWNTR
jgi:hypothetical protein